MTQEKKYIITDHEINCIEFMMHEDGVDLEKEFVKMTNTIRSRPHTPSRCDLLDESLCDDCENYLHGCRSYPPCCVGVANNTEQAIRDATLAAYDKIINEFESGNNPDITDCDTTDEWYGHGWDDARTQFVDHIKSLRLSTTVGDEQQ